MGASARVGWFVALAVALGPAAGATTVSFMEDSDSDDLPVAVAVFGTATCVSSWMPCLAVSVAGNATSHCSQDSCSAMLAASPLGDASADGCGQGMPCLAASGTGRATMTCAFECFGAGASGTGKAHSTFCNGPCYAISGTGDSYGDQAISGSGHANGWIFALSATGTAECWYDGQYCLLGPISGCHLLTDLHLAGLCGAPWLPPL